MYRGLLIVRSFDDRKMREVDKVVIPPSYLDSILTVLHIRLNHPKLSQLRIVFERYFYSPRLEAALSTLYKSCHLCLTFAKLPKIESFQPTFFPDHPGCAMNVDILKRAGQLILICVDMFSSYVTGCFSSSEKAEDLEESIIHAVTPKQRSNPVLVHEDLPIWRKTQFCSTSSGSVITQLEDQKSWPLSIRNPLRQRFT